MTCRHLPWNMLVAVGLSLCLLACSLPSKAASPQKVDKKPDAAFLKTQALVMDMADDYIAALGESVYLLSRGESLDSKGRWLALSFLRNGVGASLDIAVGPNPTVSLLDLLVMTSLQSWAFESHWIPAGVGEAGRPAVARLKRAEAEAWGRAQQVLSKEQLDTLRGLVAAWVAENADRTVVALVRFNDFTDERRISSAALRAEAHGLLREFSRVTAEVEDVRLLGERLLWFAGRYPYLLGEQAELTTYRIIDQPEFRQLVETGKSAQRLSDTLTARIETLDGALEKQQIQLFARLQEERAATVNHFFDRFGKERSRLLDEVISRQAELTGIMKELHETVAASERLAVETTAAARAVEKLLVTLEQSKEGGFRLSDVHDAAVETGNSAERLTRLLDRTDQLLGSEHWIRTVDSLSRPADEIVDRIFWRGLILIALLIGGLALLRLLPARSSGK